MQDLHLLDLQYATDLLLQDFLLVPTHCLKVNQNTQFTFNPEIELIENLGNEKIVHMKKGEHQLSAKIPSNIEIGNSIGFDLNDIFIFDENGNRMKS